MLNPTPPEQLCDAQGPPYFLWDSDMTLDAFRRQFADSNDDVRAHAIGKLMRQARSDDALTLAPMRADAGRLAWGVDCRSCSARSCSCGQGSTRRGR